MKIYFDSIPDDDLVPLAPLPAPPQPRQRQRLRRWQMFVLPYSLIVVGIALLCSQIVLRTGGNQAGAQFVVLLFIAEGAAVTLVVLTLAGRAGRL